MEKKKFYEVITLMSISFAGAVQGILFFILIFGFMIGNSLHGSNMVMQPFHQLISNKFQNDKLILQISDLCRDNQTEYEAECIWSYVNNHFNYSITSKVGHIKSPEYIIKEGGYCQEWSVFYGAILKNLNWDVVFQYIPEHVYVMACKEKMCCFFDQEIEPICRKYG